MTIKDVTDSTLADLASLEGRVAVVTGAAMGIGRAISRRLCEAGAIVVAADIDAKALEATVTAVRQSGAVIHAAPVDVRDTASVDRLVDETVATLGKLDIMVNNAGIYPNEPLLEMDDESWDRVQELNVRGAFAGSRAAARHMIPQSTGGVIITLGSVNGYRAFGSGLSHYTASKHAIHGLTRALAVELGPHDIRVVAVAPTMIETEGVGKLREEMGDGDFGDLMAAMAEKHPSGRVGVPDDIARVVAFLVSDAAAMINGTAIDVEGGYLSA